MAGEQLEVALLFRGDREARDGLTLPKTRLAKIGEALEHVGIHAVPAVFDDAFAEEVRQQLLALDGVLVWVDPFTTSSDRTVLDRLLREVAAAGVFVSAHPDTILKMGTKEVLHATRDMGWGSDTRLYRTLEEFREGLPEAFADGSTRVLKQYRGNGGNGVFKIETIDREFHSITPDTQLRVRHARRGSTEEQLSFGVLIERMSPYFSGEGRIVDQPWQDRMTEGMIRCYFVRDRVAGFGEQLVNALFPAGDPEEPVQPGPRLYFPPTREDFHRLKTLAENDWLPEMQRVLDVGNADLPVIWDADFFYGPKSPAGEDSYVLCEINVSAVFPFPDDALAPLAQETLLRLTESERRQR